MRNCLVLGVCLALSTLGCGGGGPTKPKVFPVTGKVTVGGKPLAGTIGFSLVNAKEGSPPGYSSVIAADGTYTLVDPVDAAVGAAVGKYKVVLSPPADAAMKAMMGPGAGQGYSAGVGGIPQPYQQAATSPKEVEVKAESNVINIEI